MLARSRRCAPGRSGPAHYSPGYPAPYARSCLPALGAARRAAQAPLTYSPGYPAPYARSCAVPHRDVLEARVSVGVVVVRTTWYWMYRDRTLMEAPELPSVVYPLHVPLGVMLFPVRTRTTDVVPAGTPAVHDALSQRTEDPPSSTREVNVPVGAYGLEPQPVRRALQCLQLCCHAPRPRMLVAIEVFCVATTTPSTEYTTDDGSPDDAVGVRRAEVGGAERELDRRRAVPGADPQRAARTGAEHGPRRLVERVPQADALVGRRRERRDELERSTRARTSRWSAPRRRRPAATLRSR